MEQGSVSPARSLTPELNVFRFIETLIARTGPAQPSASPPAPVPAHARANDDGRARQAQTKPRQARRTDMGLFRPGIVKPKARRVTADPRQDAAPVAGRQMPQWTGGPDHGLPAGPLSAGMPVGMRAGEVIQPNPLMDLVAVPGFCAIPVVAMPIQAPDGALMMPMPMPMPMPMSALDNPFVMSTPAGMPMPMPLSDAPPMMPMPRSDGALEVASAEGSVRAIDGSAHAILHAAGKLTELAERMRARSRDIELHAAVGRQSGDSSEASQMLAAAATVMNMAGPLVATAADLFEARAARLQGSVRQVRDTAAGPDYPMTRSNSPMTGRDDSVSEPAFDWPSDPVASPALNSTLNPALNPTFNSTLNPTLKRAPNPVANRKSDPTSDPVPEPNPARPVQAETPPPRLEAYGAAAGSSPELPRASANHYGHFGMR